MTLKDLAHTLFGGLVEHLQDIQAQDIKIILRQGSHAQWEGNGLTLPQDLQNLYQMTNGFELSYSIQFDAKYSIGYIGLNRIEQVLLTRIPGYEYAFSLEQTDIGTTLLIYHSLASQHFIGFMTPEGVIFRLCDTFTDYLRLAVSFMGIKGWQLGYHGQWPPTTQDWLSFYVPERAKLVRQHVAKLKFQPLIKTVDDHPAKKQMWIEHGIPSDTQNWWNTNETETCSFNLEMTLKHIRELNQKSKKK